MFLVMVCNVVIVFVMLGIYGGIVRLDIDIGLIW